jgi:hypothetical protein
MRIFTQETTDAGVSEDSLVDGSDDSLPLLLGVSGEHAVSRFSDKKSFSRNGLILILS